jgi:2-dehydro-3-deoxyphosphogluconate aldolase/(4S)-4-hydroxy-2-oxoglutarate aldolase
MNSVSYAFLNSAPVIPVIAIENLDHAVPLAEALVAGGIVNLEVTLRTEHGLKAISLIRDQVKGANVGVGTVCNAPEFDAAVDAGANFVVSPGQSDALFERALLTNIPFLPGAVTATEVMAAKEAGFNGIEVFPCKHLRRVPPLSKHCRAICRSTVRPDWGHQFRQCWQLSIAFQCSGGRWIMVDASGLNSKKDNGNTLHK